VSDETLLTAARRVVRFTNIDQAHGDLVSIDTLMALNTLALQVERVVKLNKERFNGEPCPSCRLK
jgi:hypothetical protein